MKYESLNMIKNSSKGLHFEYSRSTNIFLTVGVSLILGVIGSYNLSKNIFDIWESDIWNYHLANYSSDFITFTDIQSLGFLIYLAFPFIIVLLGIILWVVLVGILRISTSS